MPGSCEMQSGEDPGGRVELVTVGTGEPIDPTLLEQPVEKATGAAVGVGHEHIAVAQCGAIEALFDGSRDQVRRVVERRREAFQVDPVQRVDLDDILDLAGQSAASDHQEAIVPIH